MVEASSELHEMRAYNIDTSLNNESSLSSLSSIWKVLTCKERKDKAGKVESKDEIYWLK